MRLKTIRIIIFSLIGLVAAHLFFLQVIRGNDYYNLSINNSIRVVPMEGPRGRILDRNGIVLADNRHSYNVTVIPQEIDDKDELFGFLSRVLKVEQAKLLQKFWQKKIAPFAPVIVAEDITKEEAILLEENKYRYPGYSIEEAFSRYYPFHEVGAHVIGYVGKINPEEMEQAKDNNYSPWSTIGKNGIEKFYDAYLRGQEGGLQMEVNSRGRQVHLLGIRQPNSGQEIQLTIDQRIQQMAYDGLAGRRGTVIIMNLESGEILGMVSSPAFDPNIFVDSQLKPRVAALISDPASPLMNRAIKGLYPPGSVFKIPVACAGLATNKIDPATTFECDGVYNLGRSRFRCLHMHGAQNLFQGLTHSCNIYFYNVGLKTGPQAISQYAQMLGLGSRTEIDIPFEEQGQVPSPSWKRSRLHQNWFPGETLNMSIGQGDVLATPLQLLRMIATIGRSGREPQMYLLKSINQKEMVKLSTTHAVAFPVKVYEILQKALRLVVDDPTGTAHALDLPGIQVSGKTGTAQSSHGKGDHASFVGFTSDTHPQVGICVFLEYGGSSHNAVVVAAEILKKMRSAQIL